MRILKVDNGLFGYVFVVQNGFLSAAITDVLLVDNQTFLFKYMDRNTLVFYFAFLLFFFYFFNGIDLTLTESLIVPMTHVRKLDKMFTLIQLLNMRWIPKAFSLFPSPLPLNSQGIRSKNT